MRAVTLTPRALEIVARHPTTSASPRILASCPPAIQGRVEPHRRLHESVRGSIYDLQRELGDDSITTTERYLAFLTPEEAKAAREGVARRGARELRFGAETA